MMSNCFSVEIKKSAEKVDDEKEIIELVKKEREKEIELIRVKKPIVKPILFPYKKVVKVYEKPIGKSVKDEWNDCSFFFFFRNFRFDRSIDRSNRLNGEGTTFVVYRECNAVSRAARGYPRALALKFLRYRGHHDQVPIIKPAVREARLDHAPRFQNHEESYRVSNESCQTSSRLVRCTTLYLASLKSNR